jgi:hypothetical protein
MNWYYESAGQQQGPVPDSEIDRLLAEGRITPDTLIWREGLAGWAPLRTARPAPAPAPASPPASAPPGAPPVPGPEEPPPGYIRCTLTGKYFPPSEIIYIGGKPYCAEAKPQVMQSLQAGSALPDSDFQRSGPSWEQRETLGIWKALIATVKAVLLEPARTFATMKRDGGLGAPLVYLLLAGGGGLAMSYLYNALIQGVMFGVAGAASNSGSGPSPMAQLGIGAGLTFGMAIIFIVGAPIIAVIIAFVWGLLAHLGLMMFKGANQRFETTMRVTCYSLGSGWALAVIPVCGSMVGGFWAIVVMCIGLGKAHDTSTGKGVAAGLTPFIVCCFGTAIFYALIFGIIAVAASRAH